MPINQWDEGHWKMLLLIEARLFGANGEDAPRTYLLTSPNYGLEGSSHRRPVLADLIEEGLVEDHEPETEPLYRKTPTGFEDAGCSPSGPPSYSLTDRGWRLVAVLRKYIGKGGSVEQFVCPRRLSVRRSKGTYQPGPNRSSLDVALYNAFDDLFHTMNEDRGMSFESIVDNTDTRAFLQRVAMSVGWPAPYKHAPPVTAEEKTSALSQLHQILTSKSAVLNQSKSSETS